MLAIQYSTVSIHNVHVTRSPIPGMVVSQEHLDGRLRPALGAGVSDTNRQSRLVIDSPSGHVGVVLVAGAVARRITSWVGVGADIGAGARLGLIHFGSRTDVLVSSAGIEPLVRVGARVTAARTPIARILGPSGG
jgi:phosphatidylserine decarboxylase